MPKQRKHRVINPEKWQQEHKNKSIEMSDKMFSMALYLDSLPSRVITREQLDVLTGPTVNGFLARGYLIQHSEITVFWTKYGSAAVRKHTSANYGRQPSGRFSSYLSLTTYDERPNKHSEAA